MMISEIVFIDTFHFSCIQRFPSPYVSRVSSDTFPCQMPSDTGISVDWALLVYAVYLPFILLVYLVEIVAIFQQRKTAFGSSFYRIFVALAVTVSQLLADSRKNGVMCSDNWSAYQNILACSLGCFVIRLPLYPMANSLYASMMSASVWLTAAHSSVRFSSYFVYLMWSSFEQRDKTYQPKA